MLTLFRIDDGETHKIVATSQEMALQWAIDRYNMDAEQIESIEAVPGDQWLAVHLPDGPEDDLPATPFQDERGHWYCAAFVSAWVAWAADGDMISTSMW